jgi:RHS repeat-associated protein
VQLTKSADLSSGIQQVSSGTGGQLGEYCLGSFRSKFVTATFPDGRVYEFQAVLSVDLEGNTCTPLEPTDIAYVNWQLVSGNGTRGTLTAVGSNQVAVSNSGAGGTGYPNGVDTTYRYAYDNLNRLWNLTATNANTSTTVASDAYALGPTGIRTSVTEASGRTVNWSYDNLYRLTNETIAGTGYTGPTGSIGYTYDPVGNRLSRTSNVTGVGSTTSMFGPNDTLTANTHDDNGNTLQSGAAGYRYDFEDKLVSVNAGNVQIAYDGDGNRVAKTVGGVTTTFLIDDGGGATGYAQAVEERVGGAVQREYVYGHGPISQRQLNGSSWATSYYAQDGSKNVRMLTSASGSVTDTWDYEAFGTVIGGTGSTPNRILFAGEYVDPDLGLVYLRARWMDTATGRFQSRDTFEGSEGVPITRNAYIYGNATPIHLTDPSGNDAIDTLAAFGVIGGMGSFVQQLAGFSVKGVTRMLLPPEVAVPLHPPGVNIDDNIMEAKAHFGDLLWFYFQVRTGGPWDYKRGHNRWYRNCGNFNYGATGRALA